MRNCSGLDFGLVRLLTINRLNAQALESDQGSHHLSLPLCPHSFVHERVRFLLNVAFGFIVRSPYSRLGYFLDLGHITRVRLMT